MAVVVDTDVISFLYKQDDRSAFYLPYLSNQLPIISFMSLAELERWTLAAAWGPRRRQHLMKYLRRYAVSHNVADFESVPDLTLVSQGLQSPGL